MSIYRSTTYEYDGYLLQDHFDSQDKQFFVKVYKLNGNLIKKCDKSLTEDGARLNAYQAIREHEAQQYG